MTDLYDTFADVRADAVSDHSTLVACTSLYLPSFAVGGKCGLRVLLSSPHIPCL